MSKVVKTAKGTELPLRILQGKEYLDVQYRVLWMRDDKPDWSIETTFLVLSEKEAVAQATVRDADGKVIAQGTKRETPQSFARGFIEKAETGAVGRALGFSGFGTQFAQDLDEPDTEGNDNPVIVDAPQEPKKPSLKAVPDSLGAYVIKIGKKYIGKRLDECGPFNTDGYPEDLMGYAQYFRKQAIEKKKPLAGIDLETVNAIEAFAKECELKAAK